MTRRFNSLFISLLTLLAVQSVQAHQDTGAPSSKHANNSHENKSIRVTDGYVREPIPGRMMSAAFMTLSNTSKQQQTLVSASAPWAAVIEIHTHSHEGGVMRMRQIDKLDIPAGETVELKPGGLHLMLFKLQLPLADKLPMQLCFASNECLDTQLTLRRFK